MSRVVVVQCTKLKRDVSSLAKRLYSPSAYFRAQRDYAEAVSDAWFIQSAEYGLVKPTDEILPYDTYVDDIDDVGAWGQDIADDLVSRVGTDANIELLGGRAYVDPVKPHLENEGCDVSEPLSGVRFAKRAPRLRYLRDREVMVQ